MHNNSFYKGLLSEVKLIEKKADAGLNLGLHNLAPKAISAAQSFTSASPGLQNIVNKNIGSASSTNPSAIQTGVGNDIRNSFYHNVAEATPYAAATLNPITAPFAAYKGIPHLYDAYKDWRMGGEAKQLGQQFSQLTPEEQPQAVQAISKVNPEFTGAVTKAFQSGVDKNMANTGSVTDLLGNYLKGSKDPMVNSLMKDPRLSQYANEKGWDRGTTLAGDWLKNNWGKLALGVGGGGVLLALLYKLLGSNQQSGTTVNNNYYGSPQSSTARAPGFL